MCWFFQPFHLYVWEGGWVGFISSWLVEWVAGNIGLDCSLLSESTSHVWQNSHNSALFWHTFFPLTQQEKCIYIIVIVLALGVKNQH